MRMDIKDYKRHDVVRITRPQGQIIGVIYRTFVSGGNAGLRVIGVSKGESAGQVDLYIFKADEVELLWREGSEQG